MRLTVKHILLLAFVAICTAFIILIQAQRQQTDPNSARKTLQTQSNTLEIKTWDAVFYYCKAPDPCRQLTGSAIKVQLPLKQPKNLFRRMRFPPNLVRLSHHLTEDQLAWLEVRTEVSLVIPRNYQVFTQVQRPKIGFPSSRRSYGSLATTVLPLSVKGLQQEKTLTIDISFNSSFFGPAEVPIALVSWQGIGHYAKLPYLADSSQRLTRQLEVGVPVFVAAMAMILDHSPPLLALAGYAVTRGLRAFTAYLNEDLLRESPYANAIRQLGFVLNPIALGFLLWFVFLLCKQKLQRSMVVLIFFTAFFLQLLQAILDHAAIALADLWCDGVGAVVGLGIYLFFQSRRSLRVKQAKVRKQPETEPDFVIIKYGVQTVLLACVLVLTAYANFWDLYQVYQEQFKEFLNWQHNVLVPGLAVVTLIETGSIVKTIDRVRWEMAEKARIDRDLAISQQLQASVLPEKKQVAGLWQWRTFYFPAAKLAGDWYDVRQQTFSDGHPVIIGCVVDVTGHGIPAALVVSSIVSQWSLWGEELKTIPLPESDEERNALLVQVVRRIHRGLVGLRYSMGCTMGALLFDLTSQRLTYCTAGHPGLLLADSGGLRYLATHGGRLGYETDQASWQAKTMALTRDDQSLILYSDGLVPPDVTLSVWLRRLKRHLLEAKDHAGCPQALVNRTVQQMRSNRRFFLNHRDQEDDITILMLRNAKRTPKAHAKAPMVS